VIQQVDSFSQLNESNKALFDIWDKPRTQEQLSAREGSFVDVRDIGNVSAELLLTEAAGNERYIVSAGMWNV